MRRGFTIVEYLVVTGIIAILSAILFPVFATAREKARQVTCQSNLKQLGFAWRMYATDAEGPGVRNVGRVGEWVAYTEDVHDLTRPWPVAIPRGGSLWPYVESGEEIYQCPNEGTLVSYGLNTNVLRSLGPREAEQCLFADTVVNFQKFTDDFALARRHSGGYNAVFVDGHVKWQKTKYNDTREPFFTGL
jgi:prepilin-type processing-associated H-X9-DG protein/prepilin-type N-terminal cleavage/methylation domain-containing protein